MEKACRVLISRVDQKEGSPITRDRGRPRKITGETIKRELDINGSNVNMIYDRIL